MREILDGGAKPELESEINQAQEQYVNDEICLNRFEKYIEFIHTHGKHPDNISAVELVKSHLDNCENPSKVLVSESVFQDMIGSSKVIRYRQGRGTEYHVFGVPVEIDRSVGDVEVI